jgi:hypothetical protein
LRICGVRDLVADRVKLLRNWLKLCKYESIYCCN